jgi:predicted kinase
MGSDELYITFIKGLKFMSYIILMVGASGSGKSTKAELLKKMVEGGKHRCEIVSADHEMMEDGVYVFKSEKLGKAHRTCQDKFEKLIKEKIYCVIVDNTNTTKAERAFYIGLAVQYGYGWHLEYMENAWSANPEECFKRSRHGCPLATIQTQLNRIYDNRGINA